MDFARLLIAPVAALVLCAAQPAQAGQLSEEQANELLKACDANNVPFKDRTLDVDMVLKDSAGKEETRALTMYEKGSEKRLIRFHKPGDIKGLSVLVDDDKLYVYVPAFKKVRRVAMHVRTQPFQGTDFSLADMTALTLAKDYTAKWLRTEKEGETEILTLSPKPGSEGVYERIDITVRLDIKLISKLEYFKEKDGKPVKIETRGKFEKAPGYESFPPIAYEVVMTTVSTGHSTANLVRKAKMDTGLKKKLFSRRALLKAR